MRRLAPVLAAMATAAVAGRAAVGQSPHDHHDHAAMTASPALAKPIAAPRSPALYTTDDLAFLQHMIVHHQQAVAMGALLEGRTARPELLRFGGLVADAQRAEIRAMEGILELAAARGLTAPEHHMHGDPPMAGMLSEPEMAALAALRGPAFEQRWLEGMIFHHGGGLAMARAQELRQALEGRQPYQLAAMVDDILVVQRAEIGIMRNRLSEWGLVEAGDRHAPAVEVVSPAPGATARVGAPLTVIGVAVDDTGVAAVEVAVHDLTADRWLRRDGSWGERQTLAAEPIGSGPASAAWRITFTAPSPGRYLLTVEVRDPAGKRGAAPESSVVVAG